MSITGVGQKLYSDGTKYFLSKKEMASTMGKQFPKPIRVLKTIDKHSGEVFNILVTAFGTALVAPFFIAYNPLSKTDENTKKYSALRQPVSAVLAVATQAGLVIPWNRWMSNLSNNGKLVSYLDQRGFQDEKYLLRQAKKAHPTASKDELSKMVQKQQADQYAKLYSEFAEKGTLTIGGKKLSDDSVRSLIGDVAEKQIKAAESTSERYFSEKYPNQRARADYLYKNESVVENLAKIKEAVSKQSKDEDVVKYLKETIKKAKKDGAVDEWVKILEDDLLPKGDKKSVLGQIGHIEGKITEYSKCNNLTDVHKMILDKIFAEDKELTKQKDLYKVIKKAVEEKKPVEDILKLLKSNIIEKDHAIGEIIYRYTDKVAKHVKGFNAITGLLVSLAIMPVTCCALNYLYPRFMDTFFPHLSKAKKEGGKKCQ